MDGAALILLDGKPNRHSLNALVGALETDPDLHDLELHLPPHETQLEQDVSRVRAAGKTPVVGLSFTTSQLGFIKGLMSRLTGQGHLTPWKEVPGTRQNGKAVWVAGGPHPTAEPEETLRLGFDVVVCGEGEATLLSLLKKIAADEEIAGLPGTVARNASGELQFAPARAAIELDAFPPFPLWRRGVVGPIEITRGCPYACGYCQTSHLLGKQPRHRSLETIFRFAGVIRERGMRDVRVIASDAFSYGSADGRGMNLGALEALLEGLRRTLGPEGRLFFGTFPSEVRPEHVQEAALGLVKRFADNTSLIIGAQSGSDRVLELCGRGHRVAEVFSAVSRTLAAGLKPHVDFIFGLPGETEDDLTKTIDVLRKLAGMGALIHAHTFMPLPQTGFAGQPPGRLRGRLRLAIKELIRAGVLYGAWHLQEAKRRMV